MSFHALCPILPPEALPRLIPQPHHTNQRRKFTQEEDGLLRTLVEQMGDRRWEAIAAFLPSRTGRQCRDRYKNYLLDNLAAGPWSPDEDEIVVRKYTEMGPRWVEIAKSLNGRSGNDVKNRWHKHLAKTGTVASTGLGTSEPAVLAVTPQKRGPLYPPIEPLFPFPV
jgi:hypothetical protein